MKRLTKRVDGEAKENHDNDATPETWGKSRWRNGSRACMEKLAAYEDAEDQGRLVVLAVAPGDMVYNTIRVRGVVSTLKVESVEIFEDQHPHFNWKLVDGIYDNLSGFMQSDIGKTVFLTRAEADAALAKRAQADEVLEGRT